MRHLRLLLPFAFCAPSSAALIVEPVRPSLPIFSAPVAPFAPLAMSPSMAASPAAAPLPTADATGALGISFDGTGANAPDLIALEEQTRALFSHYLPRLYRPLPVRFEYETSKLGGGGGHDFDPDQGHTIAMIPGETDEHGEVESAIGDRRKIRVQAKIEQMFTSVHEFAHAVFDDAVGRRVAVRPVETAYDALTEGFAVKIEQLVLTGMLRDANALGLSARDVGDIRAIVELRREWLTQEESPYAEGAPLWDKAFSSGGETAMLELLSALEAKRLMKVSRSNALYQLSLGSPETASALLGGGQAELRAGFDAAALAVDGKPLSPAQKIDAAATIDAAGPAGWDWLIRRALSRESNFDSPDGPLWIVPAFIRHADDLAVPLFRLTALSAGLAARTAEFLAGAAARPDGAARVFEERGSVTRFAAIVSGAETLPWTPEAKKAWYSAIQRWITPG